MTAPRRRDRHGRGLKGHLLPPTVAVYGRPVRLPLHRTRSDRFDDLVRDAVAQLERRWMAELSAVEFAVEDVPPLPAGEADAASPPGVVADETAGGPVPLGRLLLPGTDGSPARIVVYRRPLEARASEDLDLLELVHEVLVEQVARLLGLDPDDIDGGDSDGGDRDPDDSDPADRDPGDSDPGSIDPPGPSSR